MKSSIKMELGPSNQPVIRMKVYPSEAVRDILFTQFKQSFQGESNLCYVSFDSAFQTTDGLSCIMEFTPIPTVRSDVKKYLSECCGDQVHMLASVCQELIDSYPKQSLAEENSSIPFRHVVVSRSNVGELVDLIKDIPAGTSGHFYISGDTFSWQDSENSKRTVTVGDIVVRMPDGTIEINPLPMPTKSTM